MTQKHFLCHVLNSWRQHEKQEKTFHVSLIRAMLNRRLGLWIQLVADLLPVSSTRKVVSTASCSEHWLWGWTFCALWRSDALTAQPRSICLNYCSQSSNWRQGRGCDRHQLINWLSRPCDASASRTATAPSVSPRLEHGSVCLTLCTCHHWSNSRNFWKLIYHIYLKLHFRIRKVSNCKALWKQLLLPTALMKLSKLHYTLYYITTVDEFIYLFIYLFL